MRQLLQDQCPYVMTTYSVKREPSGAKEKIRTSEPFELLIKKYHEVKTLS